jgi:ABC-type transport system involved in multi-copper enzyme maturation permease subunit
MSGNVPRTSSPTRSVAARAARAARAALSRRRPPSLHIIFQHQIRILTGRLYLCAAVLIVAMMLLAASTARVRYRSELREQQVVTEAYARELSGSTLDGVVDVLHPAIKRPWRLALVVEGGQTTTLDLYKQALNPQVQPEIRRVRTSNYRLPSREPLHWLFVVCYVLPLAAFLFGFDAVCGEQRAGRLKFLLSYPLPRSHVLVGKFLALWVGLAAPFLVGAVLSLLLAGAGAGRIPLSGEDLAKASLVALLCLWAIAFFVVVALFVSALSRDAATSLSILAWLWVLGVIVGPAVSGLLAHRLLPIRSQVDLEQRMKSIDREIADSYVGREGQWRRPREAAADDFAWERVSAQAEDLRFARKNEVRRQILERQIEQARLARHLASFSPVSLIEEIAERLTGSGVERDESFLAQATSFRARLAERVRALDAADRASPHILFFKDYLSARPLPAGALPPFVFAEQPLSRGLAAARRELALFALETVVLALGCVLFFSRYDASDP